MKMGMLLGAAACAVAFAVACGDDEQVGPESGTGGSGGTSTGGTGGADGGGSGGTSGSAGSGGAGGAAGSSGAAGSGGAPTAPRLLVAGTDFFSTTEVATVSLQSSTVVGSVTVSDGDAVPAASAGLGFILERTSSKLDLLAPDGSIDKTLDVGRTAIGETGTAPTNPISLVAMPVTGSDAGLSSRAYVFLYDANKIAIANLSTGTVDGTIDLSTYLSSGDGDGAVDAQTAFRSGDRAYFVLGRIDRTTVQAPSYELACPTEKALVMAVDISTDALVDLDTSSASMGLELGLANPVDVATDGNVAYVLSAGCFEAGDGGSTRVKHGIEKVDLTTGAVMTVFTPQNQDFLARLVLASSTSAMIDSFDSTYAEHWYAWAPGSAALGAELAEVPQAAVAEDATHLLGARFPTTDAGPSAEVVRYDTATQTASSIAGSPWQGSFSAAAGAALVK